MVKIQMTKKEYLALALITIAGGYLRFHNLGLNPFWHDEAFFAMTVRDGIWRQEFITHFLASVFNLNTDYSLRFMSALAGTLSIPAIYYVLKKNQLLASAFIAFFPIFIFWSQLSRPYAVAGLLIILSWRWWWLMIPAIMGSSISIVGLKIFNKKWIMFALLILTAISFYIRPDYDRNIPFSFILKSTRWYYLILISFTLYSCDYFIPFIKERWEEFTIVPLAVILFLFCLWNDIDVYNNAKSGWYRWECEMFSDWRNIGWVDYATDISPAQWYGSNQDVGYFQHWSVKKINASLIGGDTLTIGLGQLALGVCAPFIVKYIGKENLYKYAPYIAEGEVVKLRLWVEGDKIYQEVI